MKVWGMILSVVGAFSTALGLLLQKLVSRLVTKDPSLGMAMCHFKYVHAATPLICNSHVLSNLLLIYICNLHWSYRHTPSLEKLR
jgi:hypothetical protein